MYTLFTNIKKLLLVEDEYNKQGKVYGHDMNHVSEIENAFLITENDRIFDYGKIENLPILNIVNTVDCDGGLVFPAFCDSHTHLVFAATRHAEFVDRIKGKTYEEIAANGGGILNSAKKIQEIEENELFDLSLERLVNTVNIGTGAIEIKSGYGLTVDAELKMLRVIRRLKEEKLIPIKATFLGAHAYPVEYKQNHQGYIDLITNKMLPHIADNGLAEYIDAFCEKGFFSEEETSLILEAGIKHGLKPKIHANQLHISGGIQVGVKYNAISVDHLESVGEEEIECLKNSNTIPTLLPGAAFFLNMHYQPARKFIDANLPVAVASDFNPGSCPSANMQFMMALCCTQMKMTPQEALTSVTINGAAAMELQNELGSISKGKKANFIITNPLDDISLIPYFYGDNSIHKVVIDGKVL